MRDLMSLEALPFVDRTLRLLQPEVTSRTARWRFGAVLVLCLVLHVAVVAFFLLRSADDIQPLPSQEVPVEIVTEIPPSPSPPPPPPEPPKPEEPKPQQKQKVEQQKPKYEQALKPAFDAPRAPNEEKVEREAPHKETQAPEQQTQPVQQPPAESPAQPDTQKVADAPAPERQEQTSLPPDEEKPDAEPLNKLELQQKADKKKANADAAKTKKPLPTDQRAAMAKQLAALTKTPDYALGSMSKPAIVSGGTENTTYLSILYGLIMRKLQNQSAVRSSPGTSVVFFALDDNGNIVHQAIEKASGFPDIDAQTMDAVRRAGPFPPPPRDIPHRFFFSRDIDRGRGP